MVFNIVFPSKKLVFFLAIVVKQHVGRGFCFLVGITALLTEYGSLRRLEMVSCKGKRMRWCISPWAPYGKSFGGLNFSEGV